MNIYKQIVKEIQIANQIVITSHKSPDGDSIGSSIAMLEFCKSLGKKAIICHPDPAPDFLMWLHETNEILSFEKNEKLVQEKINNADLIFCLDYNDTSRVGKEMQPFLQHSLVHFP